MNNMNNTSYPRVTLNSVIKYFKGLRDVPQDVLNNSFTKDEMLKYAVDGGSAPLYSLRNVAAKEYGLFVKGTRPYTVRLTGLGKKLIAASSINYDDLLEAIRKPQLYQKIWYEFPNRVRPLDNEDMARALEIMKTTSIMNKGNVEKLLLVLNKNLRYLQAFKAANGRMIVSKDVENEEIIPVYTGNQLKIVVEKGDTKVTVTSSFSNGEDREYYAERLKRSIETALTMLKDDH